MRSVLKIIFKYRFRKINQYHIEFKNNNKINIESFYKNTEN